jgi:beta-aspartyl-peptidase (threonine type)
MTAVERPTPIVVASANGQVGIADAVAVLRGGGSALDAVEAGTRRVESDPSDHTVGLGGLPNLHGTVELDAAIMDGRNRAAGAVAALRGFEHPVSVARMVLKELPHVLLAGEGAAQFAATVGFPRRDLLTEPARLIWAGRLSEDGGPPADPAYDRLGADLRRRVGLPVDPELAGGTVNFLALDGHGDLAVATSTSGFAWKYPGRVGDSPMAGAGLYADNRFGAAACTGRGEMAIRLALAFAIVAALRAGASPATACRRALAEAAGLEDPYHGPLGVIALAPDGTCAAASNRPDRTYIYQTVEMGAPVEERRQYVG